MNKYKLSHFLAFLGLLWSQLSNASTGPESDGHGYKITKIEATQIGGSAGERKSSYLLKIVVPKSGQAGATLEASGRGKKQTNILYGVEKV